MRQQITRMSRDGLMNRVMLFVMLAGMIVAVSGKVATTSADSRSVTAHVASSSDDARSMEDGRYSHTERAVLVGAGNGSRPNVNGFRFTSLAIPKGATITSVEFSMVKNKTEWMRMVVDCAFQASDNATTFSSSSQPGSRALTNAKARSDTNVRRMNGQRYTLCDQGQLAASLQEIVNRPGWQSGNSVALILHGPATPSWARMAFYSFDGGSSVAPRLVVNYSVNDAPNPPPPPPTATPEPTATPQPTATPEPTATTIPGDDHKHDVPPAEGGWSNHMGGWEPTRPEHCAKDEHDAYSVVGPDGKRYPTWHPPVHQRADGTTCAFGHEHGHDPRTSQANGEMPAFGYAAEQVGMVEPHVGFKVFVINQGATMEGKVAQAHYRFVFHMGTAGVGRYTTQFHSLQYDYVHPSGAYFHINGLSNTGTAVGSTCTTPRAGGRDFSTLGCNDTYEIWNSISLAIHHPQDPFRAAFQSRLWAVFSIAVFDPILTRDPADNSRVVYTQDLYGPSGLDPMSTESWFRGCNREGYGGPVYFKNAGKPSEYWTDAYGTVVSEGTPGAILQKVASVNHDSGQFKFQSSTCHPTVHAPN